jgi:streptomycin 6-kinase
MNSLPEQFVQRYLSMYGTAGETWLSEFDDLRAQLRRRWSLVEVQSLEEFSYNYLEFATDKLGRDVVLKIGFPDPELETEIQALSYFNGNGAVRLLDAEPALGALLLERIKPGKDLLTIQDDHLATRIAGQVMKDLWRPIPDPNPFPTIKKWCQGFSRYQDRFQGGAGPLPNGLISQADGLATELLEDQVVGVLLHGDLHHSNILLDESGGWVVIDPKGVCGERASEIPPLLYNPIPDLLKKQDLEGIINSRLDILADTTGLGRERMLAWSFVRAVLSSIWSLEDRSGHQEYGCDFAEMLQKIRS